jgi:hypothetical protein
VSSSDSLRGHILYCSVMARIGLLRMCALKTHELKDVHVRIAERHDDPAAIPSLPRILAYLLTPARPFLQTTKLHLLTVVDVPGAACVR